MEITDIKITPEKKTADVWDAVTETEVTNSTATDMAVHLKTYILNEENNAVGKTETDFTVKADGRVVVLQSVLTYSPVLGENAYKMICELYESAGLIDKKTIDFGFTV